MKELLKEFPQLKDVPIAAIPGVLNQPIDQALPQVADLAIEHIPGAKDKTINSIPGLEDTPINELPFDLAFSFFAGDVFARFDIAYSGVDGPEEPSVNHALSGGSEDQKFKPIKCTVGESEKQRADNCPHFEMRKFIDSVAETAGLDSDIEGKQWVQGDSGGKNGQGVKGGKGLLKWVNAGWEPAGIHPFGTGSHTKFVLKKITEYPDKKSTARLSLAFQFCVTVPILGQQCTPHFLVIPTPFVIKEDGLFLVASRRNLPAEIARLRNQTLTAGVYCDPDQIIASAGQSDSGSANTKYGHLPYEETDEQLYNVTAVDGATVGLTKDAAAAFEKMQEAAAAQGLDIKAVSGFRDRKLQEELFSDQVAKQGGSLEAAAKISAPAGHSEHHTGLAVDVGNNANPYLNESWANTPEYAWMQQNAGKYGFELSFPKDNSQGVSYEPWHWRYAGSDQAASTFSHTADDGHNHNHGTSTSSNGVLQPIDGSTGAPQLKGIPGQPGSVSRQGTTTSTPADPDHNLRQYLARIRIGESTDGTNWEPNSQTGAYGIYQFTPESRQSLLQRTGIDGWTRDRAVAAQGAVEWIKIIGAEKNVDLMAAIQRGDFALADQVLSPWQWTSLPGGPEQSEIWSNPENFQIYGPTGDASTNEPATVASRGLPCKPSQVASRGGPFVEGSGKSTGKFIHPVEGINSSGYGWRSDPFSGETSFHNGDDYAAPLGTPIRAADGGVVVDVEKTCESCTKGFGFMVRIRHDNGLETLYAHMSAVYPNIGEKVDQGQIIGEVGSTGRSTGPHLHFEIRNGPGYGSVGVLDPGNYIR